MPQRENVKFIPAGPLTSGGEESNPQAAAQPYDMSKNIALHQASVLRISQPATEKASETPSEEVSLTMAMVEQSVIVMDQENHRGDHETLEYVEADLARRMAKRLAAALRQNEELRDQLEAHAWSISPAMAQAKIDQQAAEADRLRGALEAVKVIAPRIRKAIPEYHHEMNLVEEALSAAPAGERVVSRKVLEELVTNLANANDEADITSGRRLVLSIRAAEEELARTAPRSGEKEL